MVVIKCLLKCNVNSQSKLHIWTIKRVKNYFLLLEQRLVIKDKKFRFHALGHPPSHKIKKMDFFLQLFIFYNSKSRGLRHPGITGQRMMAACQRHLEPSTLQNGHKNADGIWSQIYYRTDWECWPIAGWNCCQFGTTI